MFSTNKRPSSDFSPENCINKPAKKGTMDTVGSQGDSNGTHGLGAPTLLQQHQFLPSHHVNNQSSVMSTATTNSQVSVMSSAVQQPQIHTIPDTFSWAMFESKMSLMLDQKLLDVVKKTDLAALYSEIKLLKDENDSLKNDLFAIKTRLNYIEKAAIRSNIVVSGLSSTSVKTAIKEFSDLSNGVLKTSINITEGRKLPKNNGYIFTLNSQIEANSVISSKAKLRGTNVFVQKDATAEERTAMFHLRQLGKSLRSVDPRLKVRHGMACLYVNDILFSWSTGSFIAPSDADAKFLHSLVTQANFNCQIRLKSSRPISQNAPGIPTVNNQHPTQFSGTY